jgi:HlyD family secretion protein
MTKIKQLLKKRWLVIGILLMAIVAFVGYRYFISKNKSNAQKTIPSTAKVEKGDIVSGISASGQIETANYLAVTTSVNGIVKKVYVKEGDKVVSGQNIMEVTLDSEGEKSRMSTYASYLKAKNSLDSAKNSLYSLESTLIQKEEAFDAEKKTNSYQSHAERVSYKLAENDCLKAKADYEIKKAEITKSEISLASSWSDYQTQSPVVTAPSDGYIANIVAVEGTAIENSVSERSVFTVASIRKEGTPIASLNITEMDINKVKVGQKVNLTLNSVQDKIFKGSVVGIDKIGTIQSGVANYPVIVKFGEDSDSVLPNMSVEGEIVVEEKTSVLLVPTGAITAGKNDKTVMVLSGNEKQTVNVTTGISDSSNTEILSGVKEGDVVVIPSLPTSGFTTTSGGNREGFGILGTGIR